MLCIRSLAIIHLVRASLGPWTHLSACPPPYNHWEPPLCSLFPWFNVFTFHLYVIHVFVFAWLFSHCIIPSRPIHVVAKGRISFLYMAIYIHMHTYIYIHIYNIIYVLYLIYPFVCWWTIWVVYMSWLMSWLLWLKPHKYQSTDTSYIYLCLQISMQKWNYCITD